MFMKAPDCSDLSVAKVLILVKLLN